MSHPSPEIPSINRSNPMRFLPLFAAITAVTPLAIDMYLPAMPQIAGQLATSITTLQNSLSLYLCFYALGMFLFGPLADAFGRKRMLVAGLLGYSVFSILLAITTDSDWFLVFRSLQAVFGGAATLVIPGSIRLLFGKDTVKGLSYVSSIMMIAPMLAPTIGAVLLGLSDWRLIFWSLAGYSIFILLLSLRYYPYIAPTIESVSSFKNLYLSSYKRVLSSKSTIGFLLVSMLGSFTFFTYVTGISFIYIRVFDVSENIFGVLFGLNVVGLMLANFVNARLAPKIGSIKIVSFIWWGAMLSALFLLISFISHASLIFVVVSLLPIMGCLMVIMINADTVILQKFAQHTGTAAAVVGTLRFGCGALAGPMLSFLYDGTAMPFGILIVVGVFTIGLVHFGYNRHQIEATNES